MSQIAQLGQSGKYFLISYDLIQSPTAQLNYTWDIGELRELYLVGELSSYDGAYNEQLLVMPTLGGTPQNCFGGSLQVGILGAVNGYAVCDDTYFIAGYCGGLYGTYKTPAGFHMKVVIDPEDSYIWSISGGMNVCDMDTPDMYVYTFQGGSFDECSGIRVMYANGYLIGAGSHMTAYGIKP